MAGQDLTVTLSDRPMATRDEIEEWLARVALGDRAAFGRLYDATSAKLFGIALRVLGDRASAEDALQEIYEKIWRQAGRYRVNGLSPMTWLVTVARNHAIDVLRRRRAAAPTTDDDDRLHDLPDPAPGPEAQMLAASARAALRACLDTLEPRHAEAVGRAYLAGETYADLAQRFDVPVNTTRSWLRRGLIKLRECLSP